MTYPKKRATITWVGSSPPSGVGRTALLIPQYNECDRADIPQRLSYFQEIAILHKRFLDVIIVDDGSTDSSFTQISEFREAYSAGFFLASVQPNAKKVGALHLATRLIDHDFIVLSDFDTDLLHIDRISEVQTTLANHPGLMGCYFRMLPHYGRGAIFRFQEFEYSLARSLYKLVEREGSVPVMPGAGSCYKRDVLLNIYRHHSGNWSGEDREAAMLGLKLGYKTYYENDILALTRPPLSFRNLLRQRVRWNLGYLETFYFEKKLYFTQIKKRAGIGVRTIIDMVTLFLIMSFPPIFLLLFFINPVALIWLCAILYGLCLVWSGALICVVPRETEELKGKRIILLLTYPPIKLCLEFCAWGLAICRFARNLREGKRYNKKLSPNDKRSNEHYRIGV